MPLSCHIFTFVIPDFAQLGVGILFKFPEIPPVAWLLCQCILVFFVRQMWLDSQ